MQHEDWIWDALLRVIGTLSFHNCLVVILLVMRFDHWIVELVICLLGGHEGNPAKGQLLVEVGMLGT